MTRLSTRATELRSLLSRAATPFIGEGEGVTQSLGAPSPGRGAWARRRDADLGTPRNNGWMISQFLNAEKLSQHRSHGSITHGA